MVMSMILPEDIQQRRAELLADRDEIKSIVQQSDGLILNYFGLDALLGLLPVVGGLYTLSVGFFLYRKSVKYNLGSNTTWLYTGMTLLDAIGGIFPLGGDALDLFFRVHAWHGNALIEHIQGQVQAINDAEARLAQGQFLDIDILRRQLFG